MRRIFGKIGIFAIWGLIIILAISVVRNIQRDIQIGNQIKTEQAKIAKMEANNKKLEEELAQTQNANFIEKEVRDKLGLGKTGEAMVVLPDEETLRKLAPQSQSEIDTLPDPNWKKWIHLFTFQ